MPNTGSFRINDTAFGTFVPSINALLSRVHGETGTKTFGNQYYCVGPQQLSRSRDWSWSRSEPVFLAGVGDRAGVGKILPTPTQDQSRRLCLVNKR